jgi:hypothetical protein
MLDDFDFGLLDIDLDGIPDSIDGFIDLDGDFVDDASDLSLDLDVNGTLDRLAPEFMDLDSDNIPDGFEPLGPDLDGDMLSDGIDPFFDINGNGIPDAGFHSYLQRIDLTHPFGD